MRTPRCIDRTNVPDAHLIWTIAPEHRDNRTMIAISEMSRPLLDALAQRSRPTVAIQVEARLPIELAG
jgi:hypothetical protein